MNPGPILDPQRMAALVQVAGGIAPALSDLLTVIRGQAGVLLDAANCDAGTMEPLNQIYTAAEKAASLIRQLLIFSGQQAMRPAIMDLNIRIEESAGVLRRLLGDGISLEFQLGAGLPPIVADADMLEQILIILALNARDAMPTGGRLRFTTEAVDTAGGAAKDGPDSTHRAGKFVALRVEDTGRGIAPEIRPRLFEPFFTTKARDRSVGLGLAMVFGIVEQHSGWITVDSATGRGSTFNLFLPVAPPGAVAPSSGTETGASAGLGTILLVEDDSAVREFTAAILRHAGYRVLQASSGADALETWKWHGARVRLLLTDMVLDDAINGMELATKLRAEKPGLKIICTSGHGRETMKLSSEISGNFRFLQKPCRPQVLIATLRALLDHPHP